MEATKNHVLETFYPISPTISLQECHIYDVNDDTGKYQKPLTFRQHAGEGQAFKEEKGNIEYLLCIRLSCTFLLRAV